MLTTQQLREVLQEDEQYCPNLTAVRDQVIGQWRPRRPLQTFGRVVATAAAVAAVAVVTAVVVTRHDGNQIPAGPAVLTVSAAVATRTALQSNVSRDPVTGRSAAAGTQGADATASDPSAAQAAADASAAAAAASSAAISASRVAQSRTAACQSRIRNLRITTDGSATGSINGTVVEKAAHDCAALLGSTGDVAVQWVDTTLERLRRATGATGTQPNTRVVAAQITGRFDDPLGNGTQPISILLILDPARTLTNGIDTANTNSAGAPIDLSRAGTVHK